MKTEVDNSLLLKSYNLFMNYTLHQLTIFLKVVETQSITKTAEALHLSQPAVSIQLKNFQEQFYIPLIEIINKKKPMSRTA